MSDFPLILTLTHSFHQNKFKTREILEKFHSPPTTFENWNVWQGVFFLFRIVEHSVIESKQTRTHRIIHFEEEKQNLILMRPTYVFICSILPEGFVHFVNKAFVLFAFRVKYFADYVSLTFLCAFSAKVAHLVRL